MTRVNEHLPVQEVSKPHLTRIWDELLHEWWWACSKRGTFGIGFGTTKERAYQEWEQFYGLENGQN